MNAHMRAIIDQFQTGTMIRDKPVKPKDGRQVHAPYAGIAHDKRSSVDILYGDLRSVDPLRYEWTRDEAHVGALWANPSRRPGSARPKKRTPVALPDDSLYVFKRLDQPARASSVAMSAEPNPYDIDAPATDEWEAWSAHQLAQIEAERSRGIGPGFSNIRTDRAHELGLGQILRGPHMDLERPFHATPWVSPLVSQSHAAGKHLGLGTMVTETPFLAPPQHQVQPRVRRAGNAFY